MIRFPSLKRLLVRLIFVTLSAALLACSGKQTSNSPQLHPSATPLRFVTEDFEIELDGEWRMEREGEAYIFNDEENLRQLTIAVLIPNSLPDRSQILYL